MVLNSKGNARKELKCNQKSISPTILTKKALSLPKSDLNKRIKRKKEKLER